MEKKNNVKTVLLSRTAVANGMEKQDKNNKEKLGERNLTYSVFCARQQVSSRGMHTSSGRQITSVITAIN